MQAMNRKKMGEEEIRAYGGNEKELKCESGSDGK